jgi:DNA-directed RNA polymerase subunit L
MSYISNFKIEDDLLLFDLNNDSKNIKISLANAIRRTIISDIYTYAINEDEIIFYENSSILNNEFLKHRLSLIPINCELEDVNYNNLVFSCKKTNNEENIMSVYVTDFTVKDIVKNEELDILQLCKYPKILFAKLQYNQTIYFDAKLIKNNSEHGGSAFSPVSACMYTFKIDDKEAKTISEKMNVNEKRKFYTQEVERIYSKNTIGEPLVYQFKLEENGFYQPKNILFFGLEYLIKRLNNVKTEFRNKKSKKISLIYNNDNPDFFEFLIDHENETVGNLMSTYMSYYENVFYCGYVIEHPLNNNIIFKIKLKENNTLENAIILIEQCFTMLIDILEKIIAELKKYK